MRTVMISDVTMKQTVEAGGYLLSFREKIELAKLLDKLGASVIELGALGSSKSDRLLIKSLASVIRDGVFAVPVDLLDAASVDFVWDALREARKPRLQVCSPVSVVQMEYFLHRKPTVVLASIKERISTARAVCADRKSVV